MAAKFEVQPVAREEVLILRELYRQEMNCQIVHDAWLQRGFAAPYLLLCDGAIAGYGAVTIGPVLEAGMLHEFYVLPRYRAAAAPLFRCLLNHSNAANIRAQTNDVLLALLLYDFAQDVVSDTILFHDACTTELSSAEACFRRLNENEKNDVFAHTLEPVGEWGLEVAGVVAATGGFFTHYNPPYGDIYMEVAQPFQKRGLGSFLVQELKRVCYEAGKKPAARCHANNVASRRTLERAGLLPCARILWGRVSTDKL